MSHECFADEIAIDFPSVGRAVERICDGFLGERMEGEGRNLLHAEVSLSPREASGGLVISVEVPVRATCPNCGGRGETWTEPCGLVPRDWRVALLSRRARPGARRRSRRRPPALPPEVPGLVVRARGSPCRRQILGSVTR